MLTISNPPVGAIAFGRSGVGCIIEALEANRIILKTPTGLKRVPLDAVIRWELPASTPLAPVRQVKLKGTSQTYTLVETYQVYCGRGSDDQPFYEEWAKLTTSDCKPAHWKLSQLEGLP